MSAWYDGKIAKVNGDGTYDVTYDELADIIFELDYDTNEGILKSDNTRITAAEASIVESF
jgi:hypothetical protein